MKLSKIFSKKNLWFLLPVFSGALLFLAYPPQNLWFLVWFALIPLFWFLFSEKTSGKSAFWGTFSCGFVFMGGVYLWLFKTSPFEWAGVTTQKDFWLALFLMIILWLWQVILLAGFWGLFGWLLKKTIRKNPGIFSYLLIIPSFWIIFEYLRSWWFEFIWLGKETYFGPHWTFGNLAYSLYKIPFLIQSADIWGVYGIILFIALVNSILFLFLKSIIGTTKLSLVQIISGLLMVTSVFSFIFIYEGIKLKTETVGGEKEVALIQTNFISNSNFNAFDNKEILNTILNLFKNPDAIKQDPDFIIAPEGFGFVFNTGGAEITKYLLGEFWKPGQIYMESKKILDANGKVKEWLLYYDLDQKNLLGYYEKKLLVPNGDYLPFITKFLINVYTKNTEFEERLYQKGKINTPTQTPRGIIGGTICSSVVSPQEIRQITKNDAQLLAVVTSDAPFHKSTSLNEQKFAMSTFRAIENRRYVVQATNMGYSFILDEKGQTIIKSQNFGNEIIFGKIKLLDKKTPYTKYGDWLVFAAFFVLIAKLSYPQLLKFLLKKKKLYN